MGWQKILSSLIAKFTALKFPQASGDTTVTQPILMGTSLFRPSH